jgi:hypothetical protein
VPQGYQLVVAKKSDLKGAVRADPKTVDGEFRFGIRGGVEQPVVC